MEQQRYMVFDNQKGVLVPLKQDKASVTEEEKNEKAARIQMLLKAMIRQTVRETVRECNMQLKEEWKEHEKAEQRRWEEMEKHFKSIDESIREKQSENKRKKHSFF